MARRRTTDDRRPAQKTAPRRQASTAAQEPRGLVVLGSTGSIGTQTLDIVRLFPERFRVAALTAGYNADFLAEQAREFSPECVVIGASEKYAALKEKLAGTSIRVVQGEDGLLEAATLEGADVVVGAIMGFAGLAPVAAALRQGKTVALANKETLVAAGQRVRDLLSKHGGTLLPVDSEHSAIFQCLAGEVADPLSAGDAIEELILTASGGPFRTRDACTFAEITPDEALDHPNWTMGAKITIDSATLMNKGLEVIEARWLFDVPQEKIRVLVHPQSVIHSMVAFPDGATVAQLGVPDMKVPIQYALSYPARWPAPHERLDWTSLDRLDFAPPDLEKFPCLRLAFDALAAGGTAPAVLNAANEAAVALFLEEKIGFTDIPRRIERALEKLASPEAPALDDLPEVDRAARRLAEEPRPATAN